MEERELLTKAETWFALKHNHLLRKDMQYVKVWKDPVPFVGEQYVIFAKTQEIGRSYVLKHNILSHATMIVLCLLLATIVVVVIKATNISNALLYSGYACIVASPIFYGLGMICKGLDKSYSNNVMVYPE